MCASATLEPGGAQGLIYTQTDKLLLSWPSNTGSCSLYVSPHPTKKVLFEMEQIWQGTVIWTRVTDGTVLWLYILQGKFLSIFWQDYGFLFISSGPWQSRYGLTFPLYV